MNNLANVLTDQYVKVEHLTQDQSNANTEGYVLDAGLAAVPCNIQPSTPDISVLYGGAFGKAYTLYTTVSGILETDRVTTVSGNNSQKFIVRGRQLYNYGPMQHCEVYLEAEV